jgi:hypothetical protein
MAEQLLKQADIGAVAQHVSGAGVAKAVEGADCVEAGFLEDVSVGVGAEASAVELEQECRMP